MIYTYVLNRGWGGVRSPADRLPGPAVHIALGILADGRRLMFQAGLDNKAVGTGALLPKPPQPRGDKCPGEMGGPARLGSEPVGPKQIRPVCLIVVRARTTSRYGLCTLR